MFGLPFTSDEPLRLREKYDISYSLGELYKYAENIQASDTQITHKYEYSLSELYRVSDFEIQSGIAHKFDGSINISSDLQERQPAWIRAKKYFRLADYTNTLSISLLAEAEIIGTPNIQIEFYDANYNRISWINFKYNEDSEIRIPAYAEYFIFIFRLEWESAVKIKSIKSYSRSLNLPGLVPLSETLVIVEQWIENSPQFKDIIKKATFLSAEILIVPNPLNLAPYDEIDGVQLTRGNYAAIKEYADTGKIKEMYVYEPSAELKSTLYAIQDITNAVGIKIFSEL
ncbi:hypothetical protein FACS189490_11970 [Clostridia bacterium]|nr:hypothetical protein FACS189490_11970 [Clostridia bacterium]